MVKIRISELAFLAVVAILWAVVMVGAIADKASCEARGGKRLRGTWPWETFRCYDTATLKELPSWKK